MFFVIFWTALVRYTWPSNSSRFFFRQSVLSDVFGLNAPAVWAQRCGAGGCRREATWIYRWSYGCTYTEMHSYLIHTHTDTMRIDPETPRRFPKPSSVLSLGPFLLLTGEPCGNVPCEEASGWELGMSQSLAKWNGHYILRSISWCTVNVFGVSRM